MRPIAFSTKRRRISAAAASVSLAAATVLVGVWQANAVQGNISPNAIEIDQLASPNQTTGANLYPGASSLTNCSTTPYPSGFDWVADCTTNSDPATLVDSVATGVIVGQTGAVAKGHWNGTRVVDGIGSNDQDIFLSGGKENDLSTWNVGPGSVGSSKYDISQAYLANNTQNLFLGMERSGNNGTTAFDFEFNQNAPTDPRLYIPTRTTNDVLLTFEMQGSGSSGSAVPHYFIYQGPEVNNNTGCSCYVEQSVPAGLKTSINADATTPSAPWGFVNSKGVWSTGNFDRFEFAEASVPLSILPQVNGCGGNAYVQVRTRSSAVSSSDMKDATKIFPYNFGSPTAKAQLSTNCNQQFTYGSTGSTDSSGGTSGLTYNWSITVSPTTATLSGGGVSSTATPGAYTSTSSGGTVNVTLPAGVGSATITVNNNITASGGCGASSGNKTVTVYRLLGATATLTPLCGNQFTYSGSASGGNAPYSYSWSFQKNSAADGSGSWSQVGTSTTASGTFDASSCTGCGQGAYRGVLTVSDTAVAASSDPDVTTKPQCTTTANSNTINVYSAVNGSVALQPDCDNTFGYTASGSGGKAPYSYAFTLQKNVSGTWTNAKSFSGTDTLATPGVSGSLDINDATISPNGEGDYRLLVTITDSQSIVCSKDLTSNTVTVKNALTATASKTGSNSSAASLLAVSASDASLQWQRFNGTSWVNISGATSATLSYSSFATDATATSTTFTIGSDTYNGDLYSVQLRVHASRTLNGNVCQIDSAAVTVKKVVAVDP